MSVVSAKVLLTVVYCKYVKLKSYYCRIIKFKVTQEKQLKICLQLNRFIRTSNVQYRELYRYHFR